MRTGQHHLRTLVHDKVAEVEAHLAEQATFAHQLRATGAAEPSGDGCSSDCGCGPEDRGVALGRRTDATDPVPIACSLSSTDMAARIGDWNRVLSDVGRRLPLTGGIRLELSDRTQLHALAAVVEAEQTCCPFISFAITVDQRGPALELIAPADGEDLLATVFGDNA